MPWELTLEEYLEKCTTNVFCLVHCRFNYWRVLYLHKHRIAHLDLKPDNLFVHSDIYAKPRLTIIDFGPFVQVEGTRTMVKGYRGTPGWVATKSEMAGPEDKYSAILTEMWDRLVGRCLATSITSVQMKLESLVSHGPSYFCLI